jgi:hypothetical protein
MVPSGHFTRPLIQSPGGRGRLPLRMPLMTPLKALIMAPLTAPPEPTE